MDKQELNKQLQTIQEDLIRQSVFNGLAVATAVRHMREQTVKLIRDEAVNRQNAAGDEWEEMSAFHEIIEMLS